MGKQLNHAELSVLHDADESGSFEPTTKYEEQIVATLQVHGYMDARNRITQLGRGALKGQGGAK